MLTTLQIHKPFSASSPKENSPPFADKDAVLSKGRSITSGHEYFERRDLRKTCTQRSPVGDGEFQPEASQILPGLYLSDMYTATSPAVIEQLGITHVLTVLKDAWNWYPATIKHACIPIDDKSHTDILLHLDSAAKWIDKALKSSSNARVLVH